MLQPSTKSEIPSDTHERTGKKDIYSKGYFREKNKTLPRCGKLLMIYFIINTKNQIECLKKCV